MAIVSPTIEARRAQMFPVLSAHDMARLERFGTPRDYPAGARVLAAGEPGPGLVLLRRGRIGVSQGGGVYRREIIVAHGPGEFLGNWRNCPTGLPWSTPRRWRMSKPWCCRARRCATCWCRKPNWASG